jgi:hypothetical protein
MNKGKYQKGITPIEDLIDMDNYEDSPIETPLGNKVNKFIRKTDKNALNFALNGNMYQTQTTPLNDYDDNDEYVMSHKNAFTNIPNQQSQPTHQPTHQSQPSYQPTQQSQPYQPTYQPTYQPAHFTCPDVFEHVSKCPICSKIYNQDKTIYILFIIVLSVIILILLKQLFNK